MAAHQVLVALGLIATAGIIGISAYAVAVDQAVPRNLRPFAAGAAVLLPILVLGYWSWRLVRAIRNDQSGEGDNADDGGRLKTSGAVAIGALLIVLGVGISELMWAAPWRADPWRRVSNKQGCAEAHFILCGQGHSGGIKQLPVSTLRPEHK